MTAPHDAKRNRLAGETSPYLLQHATNPVDWYPWGEEALERAVREDKPILLSIGYAACHWCHVMERESFEDPRTAALMNASYVCIKVDREERPDLDEIYMSATTALTGSGGWPMTVFLTPRQEPFFAGTYFPNTPRHGRPSFSMLLTRLAEAWANERDDVVQQAKALTEAVRTSASRSVPGAISTSVIDAFVAQEKRLFDEEHGGFGGAPKFPPSAALSLLLRAHARSGDATTLRMVTRTLDGMKNGGIYDHLAGGFARYSTDAEWLVPHFEKMLYDNAALARVYVEAYQVTRDPAYAIVVRETLDYVVREMQGAHGGYFSATDADSEGEEGKYFVFSLGEIEGVLGEGDDARLFAGYYDVTDIGNWESRNILHTPRLLVEVARDLGIEGTPDGLRERIVHAKARVFEARQRRVPPLLDDKVLTAWNGLMIGTMAFAARVLGEARYLESATRAAAMIDAHLRATEGGLLRTHREGKSRLGGYLEDYAYLSDALVDLYEASGEERHLRAAERLAKRLVVAFSQDDSAAFCSTARDHEALLARPADGADGAIPNANAVAARALVRLGAHLGEPALTERAEAALLAHGALVARAQRAFATTLAVLDMLVEPPIEIALTGDPLDPRASALEAVIGATYLPNVLVARGKPGETSELPLLAGKDGAGEPRAYVCRGFACEAPVTTPEALVSTLRRAKQENAALRRTGVGD